MNNDAWVYHGSSKRKNTSMPKMHTRTKNNKVIFQDISFHATATKWIAIAYTYTPKVLYLNDKKLNYNIGVNLYTNLKEVEIYGISSLEESLEALYGNGGYVHTFSNKDFFSTEGLGDLEVITTKKIKPIIVEHISDPVSELKRIGCTFKFIDVSQK